VVGVVGQPAVGSVVVALDVGADRGAGAVEGLELLAPDAALLEVAEPPVMNRAAVSAAKSSVPEARPWGAQAVGRP